MITETRKYLNVVRNVFFQMEFICMCLMTNLNIYFLFGVMVMMKVFSSVLHAFTFSTLCSRIYSVSVSNCQFIFVVLSLSLIADSIVNFGFLF